MADFNRTLTGFEVLRRAMVQMGLAAPTSAVGSSDQLTVQLWELLTQCGLDLLEDAHKWQVLSKTQTITTDPNQLNYALPSDWAGYFSAAAWNETDQTPLAGALNPQTWRMLKASTLSSTFILAYTIRGDEVVFNTVPSTPQSLKIDYQSRGWVRDSTDSAVYRDYLKNDADIVRLNPNLMIAKLKLRWRQAKGFDTVAAQQDYDDAYARAKGTDIPGETLSLVPSDAFPYISVANLPDTGYGS